MRTGSVVKVGVILCAALVATFVSALATPSRAHASGAFVQLVAKGSVQNGTGSTTQLVLSVPVTTQAGDTIVVTVGDDSPVDTIPATVSCADSRNGAYARNASKAEDSQLTVCSKQTTAALRSGDTITINLNFGAGQISAIASEFSGLGAVGTAAGSGQCGTTSSNSGNVSPAGDAVLIGAASGYSFNSNSTVTTDPSFTTSTSQITTVDSFADYMTLGQAYRVVTPSTYSFGATWNTAQDCTETLLIPFTVVTPTATPTPTQTNTSTPTQTPSPTPTATNTSTPTATPSSTPTLTPTQSPTDTPTPTPMPTSTDTPMPTSTDTPVPTSTDTPVPTDTPTPTATGTPTVAIVDTATPTVPPAAAQTPTDSATPTDTSTATSTPTPPPPPASSGGGGNSGSGAAPHSSVSQPLTTGGGAAGAALPVVPQQQQSPPEVAPPAPNGVIGFEAPAANGTTLGPAEVRLGPSSLQGLPNGIRLNVTANASPTSLSQQQAGQLGGGNTQPLAAPVDIQLNAVDTDSGQPMPLPQEISSQVVQVVLPALSPPAGTNDEAIWLVEVQQDGHFLGYMRFDSQFDPATNQVTFNLTASQLNGTLFLPVVLSEAYVENFDPDVHIWSSPMGDAVDFGSAAPQWTSMRVLGPQVGQRIFVLNSFTGEPGWIDAAGVGNIPPP